MTAWIVDGIVLMVAVEMILLVLYRRRRKSGMPTREVISFLGAGASLLIAMRVLIMGGPASVFLLALLISGIMHCWHIRQRWS